MQLGADTTALVSDDGFTAAYSDAASISQIYLPSGTSMDKAKATCAARAGFVPLFFGIEFVIMRTPPVPANFHQVWYSEFPRFIDDVLKNILGLPTLFS